jgi:hypothetical protein
VPIPMSMPMGSRWAWVRCCCSWVGIGRCWWLWSGYGYKFEGKCWALMWSNYGSPKVKVVQPSYKKIRDKFATFLKVWAFEGLPPLRILIHMLHENKAKYAELWMPTFCSEWLWILFQKIKIQKSLAWILRTPLNRITWFSSNSVQGLCTSTGFEHLLIQCGIVGGIKLHLNL